MISMTTKYIPAEKRRILCQPPEVAIEVVRAGASSAFIFY
jgi:hypothetical protein